MTLRYIYILQSKVFNENPVFFREMTCLFHQLALVFYFAHTDFLAKSTCLKVCYIGWFIILILHLALSIVSAIYRILGV
jgi:hypothetical protein